MPLSPSTITVNVTTRRVLQSDPVYSRDANCILTLTDFGGLSVANFRAALYRGDTLVATCSTFVLSSGDAVGTLSLNTAELVAVFTPVSGLRAFECFDFILYVYDASQADYLFRGVVAVTYDMPLNAGTPPAVSPITSSTTIFGNLKLINGVVHVLSTDDGEWYPFTAAGSDQTIHPVLGETGIP